MFSAVYFSVIDHFLLRNSLSVFQPDAAPVSTRDLRDLFAGTREKYLSVPAQALNEESQRSVVQLCIHIVDDDGKALFSLPFYLSEGGDSQRGRHPLGLTRTEYISDAPAVCFDAQIMAVWTIDGKAHLAVPRPRLIIALSVQIFQFFEAFR